MIMQQALPWPFTEWIKMLSPFFKVRVMKLYVFFKTSSRESKMTYEIIGVFVWAHLFIVVIPSIGQILNSYRFPVIWDLFSCTVDDMGDFVCDHKFEVLIVWATEFVGFTYAANSSPKNNASLILIAPTNSYYRFYCWTGIYIPLTIG